MGFFGDKLSGYEEKFRAFLTEQCQASEEFCEFIRHPSRDTFSAWECQTTLGDEDNCASGETKAVFWNDDCDVVIKIPFLFWTRWDYSTNPPTKYPERYIDHCACEARNFALAEKEGLADFFAPCVKLMDFEWDGASVPVYLMQYVECDEDTVNESCEEVFEKYYREFNPQPEDEDDDEYSDHMWDDYYNTSSQQVVFDMLLEVWGQELFNRFSAFCGRNLINDVHTGNVGLVLGRYKVIDYSGFGEVSEAAKDPSWWEI